MTSPMMAAVIMARTLAKADCPTRRRAGPWDSHASVSGGAAAAEQWLSK
jgi:hypothetical protein